MQNLVYFFLAAFLTHHADGPGGVEDERWTALATLEIPLLGGDFNQESPTFTYSSIQGG